MEILQNIYADLGGDNSFLIQFVIAMVLFVVLKFLLFNKLQFVLENRENKTVKQEKQAEETFEKAAELKEKYKERISVAYQKAQGFILEKRKEIAVREGGKLNDVEKELEDYIQKSRREMTVEMDVERKKVLAESDQLANSLMEKIQ